MGPVQAAEQVGGRIRIGQIRARAHDGAVFAGTEEIEVHAIVVSAEILIDSYVPLPRGLRDRLRDSGRAHRRKIRRKQSRRETSRIRLANLRDSTDRGVWVKPRRIEREEFRREGVWKVRLYKTDQFRGFFAHHRGGRGRSVQPVIAAEDKRFVFHDRTTGGEAVLVAA